MMGYFVPVALHQDLQVSAIEIAIVGKQFAVKLPKYHG